MTDEGHSLSTDDGHPRPTDDGLPAATDDGHPQPPDDGPPAAAGDDAPAPTGDGSATRDVPAASLRGDVGHRLAAGRTAAVERLFGDRAGLAVFLAAVVVLGALWRIEFLLNDSTTVANLLVNVAEGRLAVVEAPYSLTAGEQPGLVEVDGRLYGRNYGQVYLAVGVLWALDALAGLADLRLVIAAGWSLAVVALARTLGDLLDRPRVGDAGALVSLLAFGLSASVATRIDWFAEPRPLVALGASTVLLAAAGAVVTYRLVSWSTDGRTGVAAGLALVVATPVGFWASFPKRHVLSTTALLLACYLFAISRTGTDRRATLARAGAYAPIGYLASVHAFEAAFALAVLGVLDVLTAPANDRRTLALVGLVLLVAVSPALATNAAISGDPLETPRMLPGAQGDLPLDPDAGPTSPGGGGGGGADTGGPGDGPFGGPDPEDGGGGGVPSDLPFGGVLAPVVAVVATVLWVGGYMLEAALAGVAALAEPDRVVSVFLRSGWIPGVAYRFNDFETIELALLEAFPLAGALAWVPVAAAARLRGGLSAAMDRFRAGLADPRRQTDLLACAMAGTVLLVYLPYLPRWATITVRYVVPAVGLLLYGVVRLAPVRAAVGGATRTLVGAYAATLLVGGAGYATVLVGLDPAVGEAVQLHGLVGLATAVALAGVTATWRVHRRASAVATALGVAAGVTTLFLAFATLAHFADGHQALDLVRVVAGWLGWRV